MRCIAFVATRNSLHYIRGCVAALRREGLEVHVTDNDSTDGTAAELAAMQDAGQLVGVGRAPWRGHFSLAESLQAKQAAMWALRPGWVVHVDADELLHSPRERSLREEILAAEQAGFDALNFNEFVFLPIERDFEQVSDGFPLLRHYYFHAPATQRLQRAWRLNDGISNIEHGGHRLTGGASIAPDALVMRHYPFVSQRDALTKYPSRRFEPRELAMGWHRNRHAVPAGAFAFPHASRLQVLVDPQQRCLSTDEPKRRHYWLWGEERIAHARTAP